MGACARTFEWLFDACSKDVGTSNRLLRGMELRSRARSRQYCLGVASELVECFGKGELKDSSDPNAVHEANLLMLNIAKAKTRLGWKPRLNSKQTIDLVADWYKRYKSENVYDICIDEIERFIK